MAIYHLSMKPVTRATGRSAVAAAAYRSGTRQVNERDGLVHDYRRKSGIAHAEIVLPEGVKADWAYDRSVLWNAAEFAEKRKDARVAREFEVALPHELSAEERLSLVRAFSQSVANRYSVAVDFALHAPDGDMDIRNHHAHILITTREIGETGLEDKSLLERENKWLKAHDLPATDEQLKGLRLEWEELTNLSLARAGHEVRIDHRSHQDRGLELEPTQHVGVHAHQMEQRGREVERQRLAEEARQRNVGLIRENPAHVLQIITGEKSVFDRRDVARTLHRYIQDDPSEFQALFTRIMASEDLVRLTDGNGPDQAGRKGGEIRYSTREMVEIETGMVRAALSMSCRQAHGVGEGRVDAAIRRQDEAIRRSIMASLPEPRKQEVRNQKLTEAGLSSEQKQAVKHLTGAEQIAVVVGYAGAGKSTLLAASRDAWEAQGYRVHGAALAGKAADGLEASSGIRSRTLAAWEVRLKTGNVQLGPEDVLVIDEAGMVGSRQLARFVTLAEQTGAKLVLVGDPEQLQAIGAGAAFRSVAEAVGYVSLEEVRRQRTEWQRQASVALASQRTGEALSAYEHHDAIRFAEDGAQARAALVRDYTEDMLTRPEGTRVAMAHRRADVYQLNRDIRQVLQDRGQLSGLSVVFETDNGERRFVAGDRIVFLQNDRELGVKNGMLGTVRQMEAGRLVVRVDGCRVDTVIDAAEYTAFDHGYATTIHKTQGATVDRAFVLASETMDRHMTYVALTRHRDEARLYAGCDAFADMAALKARLGRSGAKETVLDYLDADGRLLSTGAVPEAVSAFARRRGMDNDIIWSVNRQAEVVRADRSGERDRLEGGFRPVPRAETIRGTEGSGDKASDWKSLASLARADKDDDRTSRNRQATAPKRDITGRNRVVTDWKGFDKPAANKEMTPAGNTTGRETTNRSGYSLRQYYQDMVEVWAVAFTRASEAAARGGPDTLHRETLKEAAVELDSLKPGSARLLMQGVTHDPKMREALRSSRGDERSRQLIIGMAREAQREGQGQDASLTQSSATAGSLPESAEDRASRLIRTWGDLQQAQANTVRFGDRARIEADMRQIARAVREDPAVERVLMQRAKGQGMDLKGRTVSQEMERQIRQHSRDRGRNKERDRSRDRGIER
ncbi:MAG: Ti-type conjugative transfer relaxase TraA [Asticcacaulis sp.]